MTEKIKGKVANVLQRESVGSKQFGSLSSLASPDLCEATWLLAQIQVEMVNFFWNGLHWVPQVVLFYLVVRGASAWSTWH